jgi:1-deoxypentalenic acid 11beta-hydroxylase
VSTSTALLVDSSHLVDDPTSLRSAFDRDGYVLLRQVVPRAAVTPVIDAMVSNLRQQGYLLDDGSWSGMPTNKVDDDELHHALPYAAFWRNESMLRLYELVLGQPVFVFKQSQPRYVTASDGQYLNPAHQDSCLIEPNDDFITAWTPLCDMPNELGGVEIAVGSQVHGRREHVADALQKNLRYGELPQRGVPAENVHEPWATADFAIGDLVMFQAHTVHRSVPNRLEGRVRLSIDTRVQPASSPRGFVATHTTPEIKAAKSGPVFAQHLED